MTQANDINNIVLGTGGTAVTVYTEHVEKIYAKTLLDIIGAQSSSNWGAGPKDTKIVDLLRLRLRFSVRGSIVSADITNLQNLIIGGGVFNLTFDSTNYDVNMDKLTITKNSSKFGEQDERDVQFTCTVGVDL